MLLLQQRHCRQQQQQQGLGRLVAPLAGLHLLLH
jgi:hypothetical protein